MTPPISPGPQYPQGPDTHSDNEADADDIMTDVLRTTAVFWGDGEQEGENPQDFMNGLELSFMQKTTISEADKIKTFKLKLKAGSAAKEWFTNLPETDKATWAQLQVAFEKKWPERTAPTKTREEKQTELKQAVLREDQLGRKEKVNGVDEWSHIAWADRVQRLAEALPDALGLLVAETRDNLPAVMRRLVSAEHSTWASFCDAVRKVSLTALREAIEFEARLVTKEDLKRVQFNAPSKDLTRMMQSMSLGPRAPQANPPSAPARPQPRPASANPQSNQGRQPAVSYRPDIERLPDLIRLALPIHPDTTAGRALYAMQLVTWQTLSAGRAPNELRPYPLSPGSSPVASGECWVWSHWPYACRLHRTTHTRVRGEVEEHCGVNQEPGSGCRCSRQFHGPASNTL